MSEHDLPVRNAIARPISRRRALVGFAAAGATVASAAAFRPGLAAAAAAAAAAAGERAATPV